MLPQGKTVWYCYEPRGEARGHYGGPSDPLQQGDSTRALNPITFSFSPGELFFYLLDYLCYRNTCTMADSDLAPNFAPFFSFVSGLLSLELRTRQLTDIPD